jgi:hypothetical protein
MWHHQFHLLYIILTHFGWERKWILWLIKKIIAFGKFTAATQTIGLTK